MWIGGVIVRIMLVKGEISRPLSFFKYTQAHQPGHIDTRVPFVESGFHLVAL